MAETDNLERISDKFEEIKELVLELKNEMVSNEDCNNQFYSVLQTLDGLVTSINNLSNEQNKPSDEYTILQTNILEVKKELAGMNQNVDEIFNNELKALITKLTEKVNRLDILTNNAGIDQQVVMNLTGQIEQNLSGTLRNTTDTLYAQVVTSTEAIQKNVSDVNDNMRECVEYLEKSVKAVSDDAVQHISDDLTVLGTTVEKTTDNLKRSVIDIFSRIQDAIEKGGTLSIENKPVEIDTSEFKEHFEMLKTGMYNLNANTEQRISKLNHIIEELDIFNKLEQFSTLRNLPAIGELKHSLQSNLNRIVDEYSYTLQTSQNRDELTKATQSFRKDVYNSIINMLGNVSEFLLDEEALAKAEGEQAKTQAEVISDKLDELTAVTELNNAGYDNIQIELKDLRDKCSDIMTLINEGQKRVGAKNISIEESLQELKENVGEIQKNETDLIKQNSEIGDVVRECTKSIIESSEPARNNIQAMLVDIKKNISILQSGDEETDYTYSMQDIESDVAKIRIYLNELTQNGVSVNSDEFTDELSSIVVMVDSMKQQLTKIDECDMSETLSKMKEDITSISTRVNKLLLTSDNSYNMIDGALKEFKVLSEEIDEQIKRLANDSKITNLESGITAVKTALAESNNYNSIINQSLIMLAEWVDNAGETITNIYENQSVNQTKLKSLDGLKTDVSKISDMLEETCNAVNAIKIPEQIDYREAFVVIDSKVEEQKALIAKQEERLNKLDEKLSMVLELAAKSDFSELTAKMNDIDSKMEKLNKSIEKLTSFVNED